MSDDTLRIIREAKTVFSAARKGIGKKAPVAKTGQSLPKPEFGPGTQLNAINSARSIRDLLSGKRTTPFQNNLPHQIAQNNQTKIAKKLKKTGVATPDADVYAAARLAKKSPHPNLDKIEADAAAAYNQMNTHRAKVRSAELNAAADTKFKNLSGVGKSMTIPGHNGTASVTVRMTGLKKPGYSKTLPMHKSMPSAPSNDGKTAPSVKVGAPSAKSAPSASFAHLNLQIADHLHHSRMNAGEDPYHLLGNLNQIHQDANLAHAAGNITTKQRDKIHGTVRGMMKGHLDASYRYALLDHANKRAAAGNDEYSYRKATADFKDHVQKLNNFARVAKLRKKVKETTTTASGLGKIFGKRFGSKTTTKSRVVPFQYSQDPYNEHRLDVIRTALSRVLNEDGNFRTRVYPIGSNINQPKPIPNSSAPAFGGSKPGNTNTRSLLGPKLDKIIQWARTRFTNRNRTKAQGAAATAQNRLM